MIFVGNFGKMFWLCTYKILRIVRAKKANQIKQKFKIPITNKLYHIFPCVLSLHSQTSVALVV